MAEPRQLWTSKIGFILAASGSAIGLGNIVFFGANAYKFGGGAFYVPYLIALFLVGIPVMMLEFGLGQQTQRAFPIALRKMVGRPGEFVGWWALFNASIITMYYITLLGWVLGMLVGSFGPLWRPDHPTPGYAPESLPNPVGYFFQTLASPSVLFFVAIVWLANILICSKGTKTIEAAVKFFVPAMWVMMCVLVVRGVTLPNGWDGVLYLFTPEFSVMKEFEVWRGAFGQIFFSLSLGFGLLTAYASYLPRNARTDQYAMQTSLLNCSFEYVAGFAIFSMLFAFAIVPKASTLAMSFFVLPQGIAQLPGGVRVFGILFFLLLLFAGLSSSISLVEGVAAAALDKFRTPRWQALTAVFVLGFTGSILFALPKVIDPGLAGDGTLGLTLLDLFDNKAFGYGLLMVGLAECVLIGWVYGARRFMRNNSGVRVGGLREMVFPILIGGVIPVALAVLIGFAIYDEYQNGLYGRELVNPESIGGDGGWQWLSTAVPVVWILFTVGGATVLTLLKGKNEEEA
jgi:NSS family neurotransmitter:Na+ symporter